MGTDEEGGYERTSGAPTTSTAADAIGFAKDLMNNKVIKVLGYTLAGVGIIFLAGKLFYIIGDSAKGYRHMISNFKDSVAPTK